jgi:hypothetical protein
MIHAEHPNYRSLPFVKLWPSSLPSVVWRGWRIAGDVESASAGQIDISDSPLGDALRWCYPNLGLAEVAALLEAFPGEIESICEAYDLNPGERLDLTLQALRKTPRKFRDWVNEKKLSPRDLAPLLNVKDLNKTFPMLEKIGVSQTTKPAGLKILELLEVRVQAKSFVDLLRKLEQLKKTESAFLPENQ